MNECAHANLLRNKECEVSSSGIKKYYCFFNSLHIMFLDTVIENLSKWLPHVNINTAKIKLRCMQLIMFGEGIVQLYIISVS